MMCERLDAIRMVKQAAAGLSEACIEQLGASSQVKPLVGFYNGTMLRQSPTPPDMTAMLNDLSHPRRAGRRG